MKPHQDNPQENQSRPRVLVVDDDPVVCETLGEFFRGEGCDVTTAFNVAESLASVSDVEHGGSARAIDVIFVELALSGAGGLEFVRRLRREHRAVPVVVLTKYGSVETAVEALRAGASDYLTKPLVDAELRVALERALRQRVMLRENVALRERLDDRTTLPNILGDDPRMRKVFDLVRAVAPSRTTVLMTGESGTGKSLIAHAIHRHSPRCDRAFIELSCGSIPETLLESELFGHVKGAFTGAHADKQGRFLAANGGTIFLDEINSASPAMQLKLLRVLQERRFEPVGSTQTIEVDVRVILASNQPLEALVRGGQFRQDLYYRINVVKIELAPLRERVGDIERLAMFFLEKNGEELRRQFVGFTREAMDALRRYSYPGNVRELQNIVERACVLARGQTIELTDLPEHVTGREAPPPRPRAQEDEEQEAWTPMTLEEALREPERRVLLRALRANGWNRQKTSEQLGINRTTLYKKMKALGILASDDSDSRLAG